MLGATWKAIRPSRTADSTKDPQGMRISLPPPPLPSEVFDSAEWYWYEGKRVRRAPRGHLDFDEEDYDVGSRLNLGTETPLSGSTSPYPFPSSRGSTYEGAAGSSSSGVVPSSSTKLGPSARRPSLSSKNKVNREADRDCGICLETAVKPCRTRCCAKMFCSDHLNDWLGTSEHCPNCNTPMTIGGDHTVMLSSPLTAGGSGETPKRGSSSPRRGSMTPQPSQSQLTPRRASTSRFHISTPTDDSPSVGLPTPPPPYHLSTTSSSSTTTTSDADTLKRLAHDLDFGVTSLLLSGAGTNGLDTPPVWTPNALQKASSRRGTTGVKMSRPGIYDAVFSSEKETLTTASRLATLVAFVLLLYVVLG